MEGISIDRNLLTNDLLTASRYALDGLQSQIWTAMPCVVTDVSTFQSQLTIKAQPAIQGVYTNDEQEDSYVNLPLLVDCPVCFPSAGGFTLTLPIKVGDEVLVIIASRCIDAWWQNGAMINGIITPQQPIELRMHDLSDGFAVPGPRSLPKVARLTTPVSLTDAQLRNEAGTAVIGLGAAGPYVIGNLMVTGSIVATGEVTAKSTTTPITLSTHVHTGVTTGSGSTGAPTG